MEPKDHRLLHYTSRLDYLLEILRHGFWPRYCVENFAWMLGSNAFIAFPVVCFCDIPIRAASEHRIRYGKYALAIPKTWSIGRDINPVWYIQAGSSIYAHLSDMAKHPVRPTPDTIPGSIRPLLPFLKLTVGDQPDRSGLHPGDSEVLAFEEEMEWRHTPRQLMHTWNFGYDPEIVIDADHDRSKSHRLLLDGKDIDAVYVPTDIERDRVIKEFPALSTRVRLWP